MRDHAYFGELKEECFNDEVGEAYYNFLLTIDTSNFNSQRDMPESWSKKIAIVELLCPEFRFLKDEFILKNLEIVNTSVQKLHEQYEKYWKAKDKYPLSKYKFTAKLREVGITYKPSNGINVYRVTLESLKDIADKHKWVHELDFDVVSSKKENPLDENIQNNSKVNKLHKELENLKEKLIAMSAENVTLKNQLTDIKNTQLDKNFDEIKKLFD